MRQQQALADFFAGLTEYTFHVRLGVADPRLTDYLSGLLSRFIRSDAVYRLRNLGGHPLRRVTDMFTEAEQRVGDARREAHRHIGDFTLFWVGVYPEALPHLKADDSKDELVDFREQGRRCYDIAAQIEPSDDTQPGGELLSRLSDDYDLCAFGLREVRRQWQTPEDGDDGPLLIN
jgi:hypothetical protein